MRFFLLISWYGSSEVFVHKFVTLAPVLCALLVTTNIIPVSYKGRPQEDLRIYTKEGLGLGKC